jgi:hypothetical protein
MVILRDGPAVPPEGNPRAQAVIEKRTFGLEKDKTAVLRYSHNLSDWFLSFQVTLSAFSQHTHQEKTILFGQF